MPRSPPAARPRCSAYSRICRASRSRCSAARRRVPSAGAPISWTRSPSGIAQQGTFNGNPLVVAAGLAALTEVLTPEAYEHFKKMGARLAEGCRKAIDEHAIPAHVVDLGCKGCVSYRPEPLVDYRSFLETNVDLFNASWAWLVNRGIFMTPGNEEQWTISVRHDESHIDRFVEVFAEFCARSQPVGRRALGRNNREGRRRASCGPPRRLRDVRTAPGTGASSDPENVAPLVPQPGDREQRRESAPGAAPPANLARRTARVRLRRTGTGRRGVRSASRARPPIRSSPWRRRCRSPGAGRGGVTGRTSWRPRRPRRVRPRPRRAAGAPGP